MPNDNVLTDELADTLKLAIGFIASSARQDRGAHVARIRALLAAHPGQPVADDAAAPVPCTGQRHSWATTGMKIDPAGSWVLASEGRAEVTEEQPSLTNPLTPYGMLVRALRIVVGTTLYDMAKALLTTPAKLSAMEFGRAPVTPEIVREIGKYFEGRGIGNMRPALQCAANVARAGASS